MLCIKKQMGTIFAIASPAIFCLTGVWASANIIEPEFSLIGSWLACLFGFIAILGLTGAQRRFDAPAHVYLLALTVATFGAFFVATLCRDAVAAAADPMLLSIAWRTSAVFAMTLMTVMIFSATQVVWRYASTKHAEEVEACADFLKLASFR